MDIVIRAVLVFAFLWLVVRVGGKREVAQLSALDMLLFVTVGDLVAQGIVQEDFSLTAALVAVSVFAVAQLVLTWLSMWSKKAERVIAGEPRVVVRDGEPLLDVLRSEFMTIADLHEAAREQGVRRLRDVELCVLENDGGFSFFTVDPDEDSHEGKDGAPPHDTVS